MRVIFHFMFVLFVAMVAFILVDATCFQDGLSRFQCVLVAMIVALGAYGALICALRIADAQNDVTER